MGDGGALYHRRVLSSHGAPRAFLHPSPSHLPSHELLNPCHPIFPGHVSREGDEDFITSELFGLCEGLGANWLRQQQQMQMQAAGRPTRPGLVPADVARLLARLRGEAFDEGWVSLSLFGATLSYHVQPPHTWLSHDQRQASLVVSARPGPCWTSSTPTLLARRPPIPGTHTKRQTSLRPAARPALLDLIHSLSFSGTSPSPPGGGNSNKAFSLSFSTAGCSREAAPMPATRAASVISPSMVPLGNLRSSGDSGSVAADGRLNAATDSSPSSAAALSWGAQLQQLRENMAASDAPSAPSLDGDASRLGPLQQPLQQPLQHPAWTLQRVSENEEWAQQQDQSPAAAAGEMKPLLLPAGSFAAFAAPCWGEEGASPAQEEGFQGLSARSLPSATSPGRVLGERWVDGGWS